MSDFNIARTVASYYMDINLKVSAITFAKAYKVGKRVVANHDSASEDAYRVSRSLIPPGFDAEYKELTKAINQCRAVFNKYTVTAGTSADGKKADGRKLIPSRVYADGSFLNEWNPAYQGFQTAHAAFVSAYLSIVRNIEAASSNGGALGYSFDANEYPDLQTVQDGFAVTIEGPLPIAAGYGDSDMLVVTPEARRALEAQYDAYQKRLVANASQSLAKDMAEYLSNMANNLGKLSAYHKTPEHLRKGKAPAIYDSLATNVQEAIAKARAFAIPETEAGSKLLDLVDQIEEVLNPDDLSADWFKASPLQAGRIAEDAAALANALDACDWE